MDAKEYEKWQREMEEKEKKTREDQIKRRKILNEKSKESVMKYFACKVKENQLKVKQHKENEEMKLKEVEAENEVELEMKRRIVKEIADERENIYVVKEELTKKNKENYINQIEEYKDKVNKAKEEKAIEDEKRKEIIRQIRELERMSVPRTKGFDPSETSGYGLLEELSLVELKERLQMQKRFNEEMIAATKEMNRIRNEEKMDLLREKASLISKYRDKLRNKKEEERKNKKEKLEKERIQKKEENDKNILEAKEKIDKKKQLLRKEDEEFQSKIREIRLQQEYLKLGHAAVEEKAFKQIEEGLERKINLKQNKDLLENEQREGIKYKNIKSRYEIMKKNADFNKKLLVDYKEKLKSLSDLRKGSILEDEAYKYYVVSKENRLNKILNEKLNEKKKMSRMRRNDMKRTTVVNTMQPNRYFK
jgi:hypothetical protein